MEFGKITAVIPTLNEGRNIGRLLELLSKYNGLGVIVSDDGSRDNTKEEVLRFPSAFFLDRSSAGVHGLTASVVDGIEHSKSEFVIVMDGDLQHPPETIPLFAKALDEHDIVVGVREKVASDWPFHRRVISKGATLLARIMLRLRGTVVADPMSGFFGCRKSVFLGTDRKRYVGKGYKVLLDFLKQVNNLHVGVVPYTFGARDAGASKLRLKHWFWFLKSLIK